MILFLIGLLGFLGLHSVRIVAPRWCDAQMQRLGEKRWKGFYSVLAIVFFVLLAWGYGLARQDPQLVWVPPRGLRHIGYSLLAIAFILLPAAHVPDNAFKAWVVHPMVLGVVLWGIAHLLMTGWLHSMILFGAFTAWAVVDYFSALKRTGRSTRHVVRWSTTLATVVAGLSAYLVFAFWLHRWLIGVAPFTT